MKLYWDIVNDEFVAGLTSTQKIASLAWRLRDTIYVDLYLVQPVDSATASYELVDPPAGWTPAFCAKLDRDGAVLATQETWVRSAVGTYSGTIGLDAAALIAAVTEDTLGITGEFTLQDVSGNNRDSSQFVLTIDKDVLRADDSDPAAGALQRSAICTQVTIDGHKVLVLGNSDGVVYQRIWPPGVTPTI